MFNYLLTVYIYLSVWQATINIIFDRVGKVDPVTRGIEIAVKYFGIQFDVSVLVSLGAKLSDIEKKLTVCREV